MSEKNGKKRRDAVEFNGRQSLRHKLAVAWLKENNPVIWQEIVNAAEAKFPLRNSSRSALHRNLEIEKFMHALKNKGL